MDWVATGFTIAGSFILAKKKREGWIVMVVASLFWVAYAVLAVRSVPIVVLNAILVWNAIRGFRNW